MTALLTIDEQVRRLRAALAEAGYPNAIVQFWPGEDDPRVGLGKEGDPTDYVCWKAYAVTGLSHCCWACWDADTGQDCHVTGPVEDCGRPR